VIAPSPTINPAIKRKTPSISSHGTGVAVETKAEKTVSIIILLPF
jgi:hypothetical protein